MPTTTVENYLKALYIRQPRRGMLPVGKLAEAVGVAPGTATTMAGRLADRGYAMYQRHKGIRLTSKGEQAALDVIRRHRLIELFLVEVVGYDWSEVHDDAEVLEHAVSDKLLARIDEMLGHPRFDPHGDPIPPASGTMPLRELVPLASCAAGAAVNIARVMDHDPAFLQYLQQVGLTPGKQVRVADIDEHAQVMRLVIANDHERSPPDEPLIVGMAVAGKIHVVAAGD